MKENKMKKRGIYYSIDALLAGIMLVTISVLLINTNFYEQKLEQKTYISQDILLSLSELKINEVNNSFILSEISSGSIKNTNNSILEQLGEYWALDENAKAEQLVSSILDSSLESSFDYRLSVDSEYLHTSGTPSETNIITNSRMIAGIAKNEPLEGFSSSAYLKKIKNKKTSAYLYFGGFVGQGNISATLELPNDFTSTRLISAVLTVETPGTFNLYINNNLCNGPYIGLNQTVQAWNITGCSNYFQSNKNNITIKFNSYLNKSYISGGYLKATYTTDTLQENTSVGYKRHYFPEIEGFINLYDAISAQGLITSWYLNMSYYSEYETYLTIGNETIFITTGQNTTQNILINKSNISLPPVQIPLRLGVTNITNVTIAQSGQPADSILVTDVSGSMNDCAIEETIDTLYCSYEYQWWFWWFYTECPYTGSCSSNECGGGSNTRNHNIFNNSQTVCTASILDVAKEADKLFIEIVLNQSNQHKIGLVDFATDANTPTELTNVEAVLDSEVDTYNANGGTCTCCGINRARTLLNDSNNAKFMIVLSDGEPTYKCSSFTDYTGNSGTSNENQQWAIDAGQEACNQNITVYTIGFGESMSSEGHDTMRQIACNSSLYYDATNVSELAAVYENISEQVLLLANFTSQTVNIIGNFTQSKLHTNSYIDIFYEPILTDTKNKISLTTESNQFGSCQSSIYIPEQAIVEDAFVSSFSSDHWTKSVTVNNQIIFNLTDYGTNYDLLGDPFRIQVPSSLLVPGANNNISLEIGDGPNNVSSCSPNNTLIYKILINSSTPRTNTLETLDGCSWTVESETGLLENITIPTEYSGNNTCSYTSTSINYNSLDAYDSAAISLFRQMDLDNDGRILIDLNSADLEITLTVIGDIPYLWGPALAKIEVWK